MKNNQVNRIFIEKKNIFNTDANTLLNTLKIQLNIKSIISIRILDIYDIIGENKAQIKLCIDKVLVNPVTDIYAENIQIAKGDVCFAVSLLPAQYNQRVDNAEQCFQILYPLLKPRIKSAKGYILKGNLSNLEVNKIKHFLINSVDSFEVDFFKSTPFNFKNKSFKIIPIKGFINLNIKKLNEFCIKEGYSFSEADNLFIQQYFKKEKENPTSIALKTLETYWSDHCRHTTFNTQITNIVFPENQWGKLYQKVYNLFLSHQAALKKTSNTTLMRLATIFAQYKKSKGQLKNVEFSDEINACSVFVDIKVDNKKEKWLIQFKNETHNHPTEIEPFGGAATCLGGAIRDPLSGRAYIYQAMRISGSANPTENIEDTITGKLPQFIISTEAASGFSSYGNQIGVATTFVKEIFHPGYKAKRMEVGVVVGASPYKNIKRQKPTAGDVVILLGGKTGKDGIGGAVGSSKSHHKNSTIQSFSEVQKGNAIEERKLQRFYKIPAVATKIKKSNDFGAGGIAVAVGELADGMDIFLDRVPLKYAGLSPQEILLSESQERMAIVIDKKYVSYIIEKATAENIEATAIAEITNKEKMVVYWHNQIILSLKRSFLNTNGVSPKIEIQIPTYNKENLFNSNIKNNSFNSFIKQNSIASQKGLMQQFDSTIGATTVLMPFGGKTQMSPAQSSVQLIQTFEKKSNICTVLSYGFDPYISEVNPFLGAVNANIESISKIVATGANYKNIHFSYQEYFEKLGEDSTKWSKPFLSLLGAYYIQYIFNLAAIGGKDSMSGTFQNISVPPTLIAFGLSTEKVENIISPEFKHAKNYIYLFNYDVDTLGLPNFNQLKNNYNTIYKGIKSKNIISAFALQSGGIAEAIFLMGIGNMIGAEINTNENIYAKKYGAIMVESTQKIMHKNAVLLGFTTDAPILKINKQIYALKSAIKQWEQPFQKIFPIYKKSNNLQNISTIKTSTKIYSPINPIALFKKINVCIPIFTGTNCEFDTKYHFEKNGAIVNDFVFKNLNSTDINNSIDYFKKQINRSQILALVGGFSAADEPDGSGKYIAALLFNPTIQEAILKFLSNGGLILGICNGFQALVRSGLLPFANFDNTHSILFKNDINKHVSSIIKTRITSNNSPWLYNYKIGDIHTIPVSHGEGKFVTDEKILQTLISNNQIATQYVNDKNIPSLKMPFNPNGSIYAIEGVISPNGQIFGKMGHSERIKENLYKNIPQMNQQNIFKNAIQYLKK